VAFKFRAQAALDLRARQLEIVQRQLAFVEADRDRARRQMVDADATLEEAMVKASKVQGCATDCATWQWYHSWIVRLKHERASHAARLDAREAAVSKATAACQQARQKCESLRRFRQKALNRYDASVAASERQLIDEIATRKYAATRHSAQEAESLISSGFKARAK
jgi:flagellar export protein FliJ